MITAISRRSEEVGVGRFPDLGTPGPRIPSSVCKAAEQGRSLPAMRVDLRLPIRIAVATTEAGPPGNHHRWEEFSGLLPPGSEIRQLHGSVHRGRIAGRGGAWLNAAGLESWFREWKPDVLYYHRLADLEFGIHPVAWQEALRISLRHVLVNAMRPPSTVHERLLVREMMMAVGEFWPGDPDDPGTPLGPKLSGGLSWLVQAQRGAHELLRWKPRNAVEPRITMVDGVFDESGRLASPAGMATFLLGKPPPGLSESTAIRDESFAARYLPDASRMKSGGLWLPTHESRDCFAADR
jgi:hypothetical protein